MVDFLVDDGTILFELLMSKVCERHSVTQAFSVLVKMFQVYSLQTLASEMFYIKKGKNKEKKEKKKFATPIIVYAFSTMVLIRKDLSFGQACIEDCFSCLYWLVFLG